MTSKVKPLPPVDELRRLFSYNPETGWLTRLVSTSATGQAGDMVGSKSHGYYQVRINRKMFRAHRICWAIHTGSDPGDMQIDHVNGIRDDNRACNLRLATNRQNTLNQHILRSNNKSGFRGVSWHDKSKKWRATRVIDGKQKSLGLFDTPEEAAAATQRDLAEDRDIDFITQPCPA